MVHADGVDQVANLRTLAIGGQLHHLTPVQRRGQVRDFAQGQGRARQKFFSNEIVGPGDVGEARGVRWRDQQTEIGAEGVGEGERQHLRHLVRGGGSVQRGERGRSFGIEAKFGAPCWFSRRVRGCGLGGNRRQVRLGAASSLPCVGAAIDHRSEDRQSHQFRQSGGVGDVRELHRAEEVEAVTGDQQEEQSKAEKPIGPVPHAEEQNPARHQRDQRDLPAGVVHRAVVERRPGRDFLRPQRPADSQRDQGEHGQAHERGVRHTLRVREGEGPDDEQEGEGGGGAVERGQSDERVEHARGREQGGDQREEAQQEDAARGKAEARAGGVALRPPLAEGDRRGGLEREQQDEMIDVTAGRLADQRQHLHEDGHAPHRTALADGRDYSIGFF